MAKDKKISNPQNQTTPFQLQLEAAESRANDIFKKINDAESIFNLFHDTEFSDLESKPLDKWTLLHLVAFTRDHVGISVVKGLRSEFGRRGGSSNKKEEPDELKKAILEMQKKFPDRKYAKAKVIHEWVKEEEKTKTKSAAIAAIAEKLGITPRMIEKHLKVAETLPK